MVAIHNGERLNDAIWRLQEEIRIIEQKKEEAKRLLARLNAQEQDRVRTIQLLKRKSK
jgi:hypothetical protein